MSTATTAGLGGTSWRREWKILVAIAAVFLLFFYLPPDRFTLPADLSGAGARLRSAAWEALYLTRWYAREHVLTCLIPAFFIAGAISTFLSGGSVMRYLGADANKVMAYGVAAVSGTLLAVCSCTVLPLFAGIYAMGAGLGPASAFLYSGPAINVLAIIFTARVLGLELGVARALGAVLFAVVIGIAMHVAFRRAEAERARTQSNAAVPEATRPLWQNASFFAALVGILVFANWGEPETAGDLWYAIYSMKWLVTSIVSMALAVMLVLWFDLKARWVVAVAVATGLAAFLAPGSPMVPFAVGIVGLSVVANSGSPQTREWFASSWGFAKQILPLLLVGVLIAGALLGRPGQEALIPSAWVSGSVGGNAPFANLFASVAGAFMYFATLTEVPILQGLIGSGMGYGPALALLLAGPALSLPNMLVIRSVIGTRKTLVFIALVVVMSAVAGITYGAMV